MNRDYIDMLFRNNSKLIVFFKKLNQEQREIEATISLSLIPKEKHPKNSGYKVSQNVKPIFDLKKQEWKAFRYDLVEKITPVGNERLIEEI